MDRVSGMTGLWFGAIAGTAFAGLIPGALIGWVVSGGLGAAIGAAAGVGIGAGVGVLISPLLMWGVARSMGGKGSLAATWLAVLAGVALVTASAALWTLHFSPTLVTIAVVLTAAGGPMAFEISHAVSVAEEKKEREAVKLLPMLTPLRDGALVGVAMRF